MSISFPHKYEKVVLGFVEPPPKTGFPPSSFLSKVGGTPVWLYRPPKPPPAPPRCPVCLQAQRFLLQIYAPLEPNVTGHSAAFHRVLYLALCSSPSCQTDPRCASVLRAQLPRRNGYYEYDAENGKAQVEVIGETCALCGFAGVKHCGSCQAVSYCGRVCQAADWKLGHREVCVGEGGEERLEEGRRDWRNREFEIVTDCHPTPTSSDGENSDEEDALDEVDEQNVTEQLNDNSERLNTELSEDGGDKEKISTMSKAISAELPNDTAYSKPGQVRKNSGLKSTNESSNVAERAARQGTFQDADEYELPEDLFQARSNNGRDPAFTRFDKAVSYATDQIVRYEWGGIPLWASRKGRCKGAGLCESCGEKRVFEMQVMPQLAYFLSEGREDKELSIEDIAKRLRDEPDWGTIYVYSCRQSCENEEKYVKEFAWMQRLQ